MLFIWGMLVIAFKSIVCTHLLIDCNIFYLLVRYIRSSDYIAKEISRHVGEKYKLFEMSHINLKYYVVYIKFVSCYQHINSFFKSTTLIIRYNNRLSCHHIYSSTTLTAIFDPIIELHVVIKRQFILATTTTKNEHIIQQIFFNIDM